MYKVILKKVKQGQEAFIVSHKVTKRYESVTTDLDHITAKILLSIFKLGSNLEGTLWILKKLEENRVY